LQGGHQAQIVQHGGTQQQRHVAHHVDAALGQFADGLHVAAQLGVAGRDGSQIAQFHQKRAQRLADFIVQFAGDGAAFLLLRLHQARGEFLQLALRQGHLAIAQIGVPRQAQDVPVVASASSAPIPRVMASIKPSR
jgi:hypothetical protein